MCGIGGALWWSGESHGLDGDALLAALRHRGPDRQAQASPAPGVWLAAARLAIRDLSPAGDQPMSTVEGDLTVVHNGEIYNARALERELGARGHRFRSRGDTEALLHGYREWGDEVVDHLDGMFAFALWDRPRRRLLMARDPLGVKPLWLARTPGRIAFASEVRALLAAGAAGRSIDGGAVSRYLSLGSVVEPGAILRGVEALAPGHRLAVDRDGRERITRYFTLPPEVSDSPSAAAAATAVRAYLEESVAGCLESDVPVALLLSGGVDSSAIALLARRHAAPASLSTFHVRIGERAAARARTLAATLGVEHREVTLDATPEALLAALDAQDQPSVDGANTFLIARAIRDAGLKVALTGLGADEIFLGYPLHRHYVTARRWQGRAARLDGAAAPLRSWAAWVGRTLARHPGAASWRVEKLAGVAAADGATETWQALRALFPAAAARRLAPDLPAGTIAPGDLVGDSPPGGSSASEGSRLDVAGYLVNTLLRDADVMSMAHGVELRVPLLDRRLVETVLGLGAALKLRAGRLKPLLVDAVPELSPEVREAPKEGFVLPLDRWLLGSLRAPVEALLVGDGAAARRVGLEPGPVADVWRRFLAAPDGAGAHRVWALHSLVRWAHAHGASA